MLEPQEGLEFERMVALALRAFDLGFEGTFRSDHYSFFQATDMPQTDAWASLAGLVREVPGGIVGTLVSPLTFRQPGELAKVVSTVAHMSKGATVEVGLGTGWNPQEHSQFGLPFPDFAQRYRMLTEYIQVVRGVLSGEAFSFAGEFYTLEGCLNRPPAPDVRILIGGGGSRRTPRLAARFADELNVINFRDPLEIIGERVKLARSSLAEFGRPEDALSFSWMGPFALGRSADEASERAARIGPLASDSGRIPFGTVADGAAFLRRLGDQGIERVMLQFTHVEDDEQLELAAEMIVAAR